MVHLQLHEQTGSLVAASVPVLFGILLIAFEPVSAQDRGRADPSMHPTPSQHGAGSAVQRGGADRSTVEAPGTGLPPATRPSDPPFSFGQSRGGTTVPRGRMQTNDGPGIPSDRNQVPLGGTEWLAAAGAAYALNRLRKTGEEESEDDA